VPGGAKRAFDEVAARAAELGGHPDSDDPRVRAMVALAFYFRLGTPTGSTVDLATPVRGRWVAVDSPTTRVPSHGVHAWGQTYAVDLVFDPGGGSRPGFGWRPVWLVVESGRELLGPGGILGNHLVVRGDDGTPTGEALDSSAGVCA
jgi:hypothetical protein